MKVLMISKDPSIFKDDEETPSDTRLRHIKYAEALRNKSPGSEIKIVVYTENDDYKVEQPTKGLQLYPTNSRYRFTFILDAYRVISDLIEDWTPDLVTTQSPYEEGLLGLWLKHKTDTAFLPQLHFDIFSKHWVKEKWVNRIKKFMGLAILKRATGIRVVSDALKKKVQKHLGITEDNIRTIPVGVNFSPPKNFQNKSHYKKKLNPGLANQPVILFVGRMVPQKNLPLWINVAESIHEKVPETHFVLAGDGPKKENIQKLTRAKELEEVTHFTGAVGYQKIPELYAAADLFLLTSKSEGYGRVVVEAYFTETPVVSTRSTGPEDLIKHDETGFLHGTEDKSSLTESCLKLIKNRQLAKKMGEKGRKFLKAKTDPDNLIDKLITCWQNAVKNT